MTITKPAQRDKARQTEGEGEIRLRIGNTTLEAVDRITGMTADEIEVVAERLMDGARETEEILRELARRVRQHGLFANEKLATFITSANKCAETARTMQSFLAERDRQAAVLPSQGKSGGAQRHGTEDPTDLSALEAEIKAISSERAPPTQPGD